MTHAEFNSIPWSEIPLGWDCIAYFNHDDPEAVICMRQHIARGKRPILAHDKRRLSVWLPTIPLFTDPQPPPPKP